MKIKIPPQKWINVVLTCLFIIVFSLGLHRQNSKSMRLSDNDEITQRPLAVKTQNSCIPKNDTLRSKTQFVELAKKTGGYTQEDHR